jgi:hypothetical protein
MAAFALANHPQPVGVSPEPLRFMVAASCQRELNEPPNLSLMNVQLKWKQTGGPGLSAHRTSCGTRQQ